MEEDSSSNPTSDVGEILNIGDEGVLVQGHGGNILIKLVQPPLSVIMPSYKWASTASAIVGKKLGV